MSNVHMLRLRLGVDVGHGDGGGGRLGVGSHDRRKALISIKAPMPRPTKSPRTPVSNCSHHTILSTAQAGA